MANSRKLENDLNRIRREENALLVLVIKPDRSYISTMPELRPDEVIETLRNEILAEHLSKRSATR
jgi:hypothetical protein